MSDYDARAAADELTDLVEGVRRAVKAAGDGDRARAASRAVKAALLQGADAADVAALRSWVKAEKIITAADFNAILKEAVKERTRQASAENTSRGVGVPKTLHTCTPMPDLASEQDILSKLCVQLSVHRGVTGEDRNVKLAYLTVTSRHLRKPVSVIIKGLSSSGKSYPLECVVEAFAPDGGLIVMSGMSEHALVYWPDDFRHKTIILYEATGLKEAKERTTGDQTAGFLRTLISENRIVYPTVRKDESGNLVTEVIEREGPVNVIVTTTAGSLHHENETRMLSLYTNESKEQTAAILAAIAAQEEDAPQADWSEWHSLDRWLGQANHEVVVPFARWMAAQIPPRAVRLRRDFSTLLALIKAHAMLHQANRETDDRGRIIATEADYLAIRELVTDVLSDQVSATVKATTRQTVEAVASLGADGHGVTVKEVADHLDLERSVAQKRVSAATAAGFLVNIEERPGRGRPGRYRPGEPLPEDVPLLPKALPPESERQAPASHTNDAAQEAVHTKNDESSQVSDDEPEWCASVQGKTTPEAAQEKTSIPPAERPPGERTCPRHDTAWGRHKGCRECDAANEPAEAPAIGGWTALR
jgi:hypothetical protein